MISIVDECWRECEGRIEKGVRRRMSEDDFEKRVYERIIKGGGVKGRLPARWKL